MNRATAHFLLRNFDEALADASRAIELDPDDARFVTVRGFIHCDRGNIDLARDDWAMSRSLAADAAARAALDAQIAATPC